MSRLASRRASVTTLLAGGRLGLLSVNWSTPRSYVGTCRAMYVVFSDGTTSPVVHFTFKR